MERCSFDAMILTTKDTLIKARCFGVIPDGVRNLKQLQIQGLIVNTDEHPHIKKGDTIPVKDIWLEVCNEKR